jgi:type 1 glutamine amidotransferase
MQFKSFAVFPCLFVCLWLSSLAENIEAAEPLRGLLITGGCCHDYQAQKKILTDGIGERANIVWTVIHEGDEDGKNHKFSIYEKPDWAKGFDVVLHNECSGAVSNVDFVEHIAKAHFAGVPAVVLHCSIHSYRMSSTDEWRKLLGVSSYQHQVKRPFAVEVTKAEHPVMRGFPVRWQDQPDELYEIKKVWPNCTPLADGITPGKETDRHPVVWVNTYGKARVFGTTLGHGNETMQKTEYLDLITRGLLWACNKLNEDGMPRSGFEGKRPLGK